MKTKLDTLKEAFLNKDYKKAISIASKFPRLGNEKEAIKLAQDCIMNPSFYKQLGYNIDDSVKAGINALSIKYSLGV